MAFKNQINLNDKIKENIEDGENLETLGITSALVEMYKTIFENSRQSSSWITKAYSNLINDEIRRINPIETSIELESKIDFLNSLWEVSDNNDSLSTSPRGLNIDQIILNDNGNWVSQETDLCPEINLPDINYKTDAIKKLIGEINE